VTKPKWQKSVKVSEVESNINLEEDTAERAPLPKSGNSPRRQPENGNKLKKKPGSNGRNGIKFQRKPKSS